MIVKDFKPCFRLYKPLPICERIKRAHELAQKEHTNKMKVVNGILSKPKK